MPRRPAEGVLAAIEAELLALEAMNDRPQECDYAFEQNP